MQVRAAWKEATPEVDVRCVQAADPLAHLTVRQRQVIELLLNGSPNKVIARELGISPNTVKVHLHAAFRELGVHNRIGVALVVGSRRKQNSTQLVKSSAVELGSEEQSIFRFGKDAA